VKRLESLDAFRGFAIASMILVNNPGDWGHLYAPLAHAKWNGATFTDTVFPFFLFAAGMAMAVSVERRRDEPGLVGSFVRRSAVIFLVGLFLNLFPFFNFETVRIPGVLQRIALCVMAAAPLAIYASSRWIAAAIVALFAVYAVPMLAYGTLEPGQDFGAAIDRAVFGVHLWSQSKTWDPEGLWSTLPAIASLLFGVLTGRWMLIPRPVNAAAARLLAAGLVALAVGLVLDAIFMPINKNLWTPSYSVFMTGWALVVFAFLHAIAERARKPLQPLVIYGMNALFLFALSGLIARILGIVRVGDGTLKAWLFAPLQRLGYSPELTSLFFAIDFNLFMFAIAWAMWRKGWFIRA
jgi:predicted acyltransferase